jgi:hypothetical protein
MTPLVFAAFLIGADPEPIGSFLYQPAYSIDHVCRLPARPYCPQAGDIVLATDDKIFWKLTHNLAWTGHPHHTGVVFQRCDGSFSVLEAGPHDTRWINNLDLLPHLRQYEEDGLVWVRARKTPLTAEQSACLTAFCERQEGKKFAIGRLVFQLSFFRPRGPFTLKTRVMGKPHGDRNKYYCSELAVEALIAAGALDPERSRPAAMYPRDIFMDRSPNLYLNKIMHFKECWDPPARWTHCPVNPGSCKD